MFNLINIYIYIHVRVHAYSYSYSYLVKKGNTLFDQKRIQVYPSDAEIYCKGNWRSNTQLSTWLPHNLEEFSNRGFQLIQSITMTTRNSSAQTCPLLATGHSWKLREIPRQVYFASLKDCVFQRNLMEAQVSCANICKEQQNNLFHIKFQLKFELPNHLFFLPLSTWAELYVG